MIWNAYRGGDDFALCYVMDCPLDQQQAAPDISCTRLLNFRTRGSVLTSDPKTGTEAVWPMMSDVEEDLYILFTRVVSYL